VGVSTYQRGIAADRQETYSSLTHSGKALVWASSSSICSED
jgi:hypothetical protein